MKGFNLVRGLSRVIDWVREIPYRLPYWWNKIYRWLVIGMLNIGLLFFGLVWYTMPKEERPLLSLWIKARIVATILPEKQINLSFKNRVYRLPAKTSLTLSWSKKVTQHLKECRVFTEWLICCELLLVLVWVTLLYLRLIKKSQHFQKKNNANQVVIGAFPHPSNDCDDHEAHKVQGIAPEKKPVVKTKLCKKRQATDRIKQRKRSIKSFPIAELNQLNVMRHMRIMNRKMLNELDLAL